MGAMNTKKIALLVLVAGVAGVTVMRDKVLPQQAAPAVVAPKPAPVAPAQPMMRTKADAATALLALPELKAWSAHIEKATKGKSRGALIEDDAAPRGLNGKYYWQFTFVENSPERVHRWETFLVASTGDEILVDDFADDKQLTLEQWRKEKRPLERAGGN